MAKGKTVLKNCAVEPEVKDLISFLNKLGGKIKVSGRNVLIRESKINNNTINHKVIFDRIEAGTYMIAGALIGKNLIINKITPKIIKSEIEILKKMGTVIETKKNSIKVSRNNNLKKQTFLQNLSPVFLLIYKRSWWCWWHKQKDYQKFQKTYLKIDLCVRIKKNGSKN